MKSSLQYGDWLHLSLHLLWGYDEDRSLSSDEDPRPNSRKRREIDDYSNSGAWLVRRGWIEVEHDGVVTRAHPGEWLIVRPTRRVQRFSDKIHILSIAYEANWPDGRPLLDEV